VGVSGQWSVAECSTGSVVRCQLLTACGCARLGSGWHSSSTTDNLGKSTRDPVESTADSKAGWGEHFAEPGMFAARVDDAMKSSGNTKKLTGVSTTLVYSVMKMIRVNGGGAVRFDHRRDATVWKQGICDVAKHWVGRRRFFYSVAVSNIQ
jgi:hypothetical protein